MSHMSRDAAQSRGGYIWFMVKWTLILLATWLLCIVLFTSFHPAVGFSAIGFYLVLWLLDARRLVRRSKNGRVRLYGRHRPMK
jgi:hypothetical protein